MPRKLSRSSFVSKAPTNSSTSSPIHHNVKVEQPGFFSSVFQGFGLGTGQAIAHNIFRSDPVVKHVTVPTPVSEASQPNAYIQCMKEYDNKELCEQYLENK